MIFFPLFTLHYVGIRVLSVKALLVRSVQRVTLEWFLIGLHLAVYIGALWAVLPTTKACMFVAVHHMILGLYAGVIFAPNHRAMPVRDGVEVDWLHRQVLSSRNLRSGRIVDFIFGGLNHHIEHHLFPTMPRRHLRKAQPIVHAFCVERNIPYREVGLIESYSEILKHLVAAGRVWRSRS